MGNQEKKPKNPSAFPVYERNIAGDMHLIELGMTLRDYFAAKIMQGIFSNSEREPHFGQSKYYVEEAYGIADAMLKEREKE